MSEIDLIFPTKDYEKIGLEKVLLTCDISNIASTKTIIKCSSVLEKEEKQWKVTTKILD